MKINETKMKKAQEEALKILQETEDKSQAVVDAVDEILSVQYEELINELQEQATRAESNTAYAKSLGLRKLSKAETEFYEALKDVKQALPGDQIDILPNTIIDVTLEDIKKESGILNDVNFTPANVKKWIIAEKEGTYSWGELTEEIKGQLRGSFTTLNMEVSKLTAYLVIPKAIRDLALPFVDKYFTAILKEILNDGLEFGYLQGTGKDMPIGIYKQIGSSNEDGTHKDKVVNRLTAFTPKALAPAKKYLSKNGLRTFDSLVLICHPNDEADYVAPAIYDREGKLISSYKNLTVKTSANNPQGKAVLLIPKKYTMGLSNFGIKNYDQTMAMDDADVVIGKGYSNGRATDDNTAFVFDVTELKEYIPAITVVGNVTTVSPSDDENQEEETVLKYTVSYNANGGTGTIESVEVTAGESITLSDGTGLTAPEGKEFKGWAKSSSAQNPTVTSPFTPDSDTTLYAVYGDE